MKTKGRKMMIVLLTLLISCSSALFAFPYQAYAIANNSENIMPMADVLVWRYKMVNGITYKRLYNGSTKQWVGDWIRCK